jgi:NADP-dependent 3-hydroxy acid dehydrogenase YdfG
MPEDHTDSSIALVTGADKSIGRKIARQLAAAGHTVYVGSRDESRGKDAGGDIGGGARLLVLDVTDAARIAAATGQVPSLDILVKRRNYLGRAAAGDRGGPGNVPPRP